MTTVIHVDFRARRRLSRRRSGLRVRAEGLTLCAGSHRRPLRYFDALSLAGGLHTIQTTGQARVCAGWRLSMVGGRVVLDGSRFDFPVVEMTPAVAAGVAVELFRAAKERRA